MADDFGRGRVFPPYRDVPSGKDKTPYKLHFAGHSPAGYISFSPVRARGGSGLYMPEPDQLQRFPAASTTGIRGQLESIVATLREDGYDVGAAWPPTSPAVPPGRRCDRR